MAQFTIDIELEDTVRDIARDVLADEFVREYDFEDKVSSVLDGRDLATREEVDAKLEDYLTFDNVDTKIEDVLANGGYITESGFADAASNEGYITEDDAQRLVDDALEAKGDFATENDLAGLDGRIDRIAHKLEQRIAELAAEARGELLLEGRVEALEGLDRETSDRIGDLASLLGNANARLDLQNQRIAELETRLADRGELGMALTFFGLLRQAFAALR